MLISIVIIGIVTQGHSDLRSIISSLSLYTCFPELVSVPYDNQTMKTNISKTPRQKLKVNTYSYRVGFVLSEYNFTFNFCRGVFEILVFIHQLTFQLTSIDVN